MKLNLSKFCFFITLLLIAVLCTRCKRRDAPGKKDVVPKQSTIIPGVKNVASKIKIDSIELISLVRKLYKWHETTKMKYDGFKPLKSNKSDTLYTSIDLGENQRADEELKETGLFTDSFLNNYRKIAIRMDKELRDGSSLWPEGELSTFGDDSDAWCNCQDFPIDKYWTVIRLVNIKIENDTADFKWTWGDDFYYKAQAIKAGGTWEISYLQGFDMNAYSWEWWAKNKPVKL